MIRAIIGLGNPGPTFTTTRHNIGFNVLNALAEQARLAWKTKDSMLEAQLDNMLLIKPLTFMNNSGNVLPYLQKKGIAADEILVVHDELELPFGTIKIKQGGSHKGHNGLRSIIEKIGPDFHRLRFGISRPEHREDVPDYVLASFSKTETEQVSDLINEAIEIINTLIQEKK